MQVPSVTHRGCLFFFLLFPRCAQVLHLLLYAFKWLIYFVISYVPTASCKTTNSLFGVQAMQAETGEKVNLWLLQRRLYTNSRAKVA